MWYLFKEEHYYTLKGIFGTFYYLYDLKDERLLKHSASLEKALSEFYSYRTKKIFIQPVVMDESPLLDKYVSQKEKGYDYYSLDAIQQAVKEAKIGQVLVDTGITNLSLKEELIDLGLPIDEIKESIRKERELPSKIANKIPKKAIYKDPFITVSVIHISEEVPKYQDIVELYPELFI